MRTRITAIGAGIILFTYFNALIAESVSTVQLERAYTCSVKQVTCKPFGFIRPQ